ncbi:ribonuclease Z [Paenibacillus larvae]|uniref:Ribonuclease Z n=4 Tax=Paenibacillus larvae TaxID=1464 RepID=V9WB86_9BACL|nr:ribonuclease Z [Paenibacillus larvae]AHD06377.1 ribonuclease Z [Paenibacillus larvae subsp. larvae DSM 25430]AQR77856.1 ribonuclease Z [Paenibacillus larvae subsp. larvae]AQT86434.1 ribonuclease Z [Paenibacillus larvae subsp. pulvifaciens]AQZ48089.1 ribonuclease Z [Paenibacillus larvae subsp. pulvifaciens]AVF21033.1 ribonuclease Z [Paenibacillus larvae subsp. larvae]
MELYFLGTGAGSPAKHRNVTSIVLNLLPERGSYWLFDCGEGTQHQILKSPIRLGKVDKIFITHLHGDHLYGLPGVLTSRCYQGGEDPLVLYGPKGIGAFVRQVLDISGAQLTYKLRVVEIEHEGNLYEDDRFSVEARRLNHRIESFGYRIVEKDLPGKLDHARLKALGVPAGPLFGRLKNGESITLENGQVIHGPDYVGEPVKGRIITILGDTQKTPNAVKLAQGADLLVHEATFGAERQDLAGAYGHSTTIDAARTAEEAGVGTLVLTHISSRYGEDASSLAKEARRIHAETFVAEDFWSISIPRKDKKGETPQENG